MKNWKHACWLAKFELQASLLGLVWTLLGSLMVCLFFYFLQLDPYSKSDPMLLFDLLFLLSFTVVPLWSKPKAFQISKDYRAPGMELLLTMPAVKDEIAKSRMIIYIVYSLVFQIPLLVSFYFSSSLVQAALSPLHYLSFAIIWLSFGLYAGTWCLSAEFGQEKTYKKWELSLYFILTALIAAAIYKAIKFAFGSGLVYGTITAARNWPLAAILISIFLAAAGLHFIHQYNLKLLKKVDYL